MGKPKNQSTSTRKATTRQKDLEDKKDKELEKLTPEQLKEKIRQIDKSYLFNKKDSAAQLRKIYKQLLQDEKEEQTNIS